jgi:hypothetical protein
MPKKEDHQDEEVPDYVRRMEAPVVAIGELPLSPRFAESLKWMETESKFAHACPDLDQEFPMTTTYGPAKDFPMTPPHDPVDHPKHYTSHPSGIECIQITEHMGFSLGNAVKYIWRADLKADAIEDLRKARWYLDREIDRREAAQKAG